VRKCEQQHPRIPRKAARWVQPVVRRMLGGTPSLGTAPSLHAGRDLTGWISPLPRIHTPLDSCAGLRHSVSTCLARLGKGESGLPPLEPQCPMEELPSSYFLKTALRDSQRPELS